MALKALHLTNTRVSFDTVYALIFCSLWIQIDDLLVTAIITRIDAD